jgi:hypothetical protein
MKKFNRLFVSEGLVDDFLSAQEKGEKPPIPSGETLILRSFDLNKRLSEFEGLSKEIQAIKFEDNNIEIYFKEVDHNQEEG